MYTAIGFVMMVLGMGMVEVYNTILYARPTLMVTHPRLIACMGWAAILMKFGGMGLLVGTIAVFAWKNLP